MARSRRRRAAARAVGEFLDYARPGTTRRERVELEELCRKVLRDAEAAGWGLRSEAIATVGVLPAAVDRDQLQRALANLVRNAFEATGIGGSLRLVIEPGTAGRVRLLVEDDGPGIPEAMVARVFRPFQTTKNGGTGLGLALHARDAGMGGWVRIAARLTAPVRYALRLPLATDRLEEMPDGR